MTFNTLADFLDAAKQFKCKRFFYSVQQEKRFVPRGPEKSAEHTLLTLVLSAAFDSKPFPLIAQFVCIEMIKSSEPHAVVADEAAVRARYEGAVDAVIVGLREVIQGAEQDQVIYPTALRGLLTWLGDRQKVVGTDESLDMYLMQAAWAHRQVAVLSDSVLVRVEESLRDTFPDFPVPSGEAVRSNVEAYRLYVEELVAVALDRNVDNTKMIFAELTPC